MCVCVCRGWLICEMTFSWTHHPYTHFYGAGHIASYFHTSFHRRLIAHSIVYCFTPVVVSFCLLNIFIANCDSVAFVWKINKLIKKMKGTETKTDKKTKEKLHKNVYTRDTHSLTHLACKYKAEMRTKAREWNTENVADWKRSRNSIHLFCLYSLLM